MGALAARTLTPLLQPMVRDNHVLDVQLAHEGLLDGDCICGVPLRFHRLPSNAQVDCREALDRFLIGDQVPQAHERVEPTLRRAQIGGGDCERAQRIDDDGVQVIHAAEPTAHSRGGPCESASETPREGEARR